MNVAFCVRVCFLCTTLNVAFCVRVCVLSTPRDIVLCVRVYFLWTTKDIVLKQFPSLSRGTKLALACTISLCRVSRYASEAGASELHDLAVDPQMLGRNQARKVKKAFKFNSHRARLYMMSTPLWCRQENKRVIVNMPVRLPGEALADLYKRSPESFDLTNFDHQNICTPSYMDHPLTKKLGFNNVLPAGLYVDKVKYNGVDSFVRCSIGLTHLRQRLTCWVVQCSRLCDCGCGGRCTLDAIEILMNSNINDAQEGRRR